MAPPMFALACARDYVTTSRTRKTIDAALIAMCLLLVVVWAIRLINPADAGLLFGGHVPVGVPADIIHLEQPRWLIILRSYLS